MLPFKLSLDFISIRLLYPFLLLPTKKWSMVLRLWRSHLAAAWKSRHASPRRHGCGRKCVGHPRTWGSERHGASRTISKKDIIKPDKKMSKKSCEGLAFQKSADLHQEVYPLLYSDKKDLAPLLSSDTGQGHRTMRAKLGSKKTWPWKRMPFTNPACKDGAHSSTGDRQLRRARLPPSPTFNETVGAPAFRAGVPALASPRHSNRGRN